VDIVTGFQSALTISGRKLFLRHAAKIFDLCALISCFLLVTIVVHYSSVGITIAEFLAMRVKLSNCLRFALLLIAWHELFIVCGLYASKRLTRRRVEMGEVSKGTFLASAFLFLSSSIFHIGIVNSKFILLFWASSTCMLISARLAARSLLRVLRRRGRNSRFVLVVGTNPRAIGFVNEVKKCPELGYNIVGFVDDDWKGIEQFHATGHKRCCTFSELADFLRQNVVDEVAIYLPLRSYYEHAAELISLCEQHGVAIRLDSQIFNLRIVQSRLADLEDNSSVSTRKEIWPLVAKRAIDCLLSLLGLIMLLPIFLCAAILVKLTSRGPVFFRQTRVGLNKRHFKIYKFRTMVDNAEQIQEQFLSMNEMVGPAFKIKKDPRVTPVGRLLRKTSIDELPQLLNVLKGDMSLVGPRAMSLRDYRLFEQDWQRRRFSVKPGITCLWQVNGRSSIPFEQWMELDMQYIDGWSLWLDFKILAQTVPAVLRGTGAA
jgi:exopolysaccharide biosynthesis polyprenyl glycosylphosphotransferase